MVETTTDICDCRTALATFHLTDHAYYGGLARLEIEFGEVKRCGRRARRPESHLTMTTRYWAALATILVVALGVFSWFAAPRTDREVSVIFTPEHATFRSLLPMR